MVIVMSLLVITKPIFLIPYLYQHLGGVGQQIQTKWCEEGGGGGSELHMEEVAQV